MHPVPAHVRRLTPGSLRNRRFRGVVTDSAYLATALAVFVVAAAVQLYLYRALLRSALASGELEQARPAFRRWIVAAAGWQGIAIVGAGVYVYLVTRQHPAGVAWVAPALAVLLGTALPLQIVASTALRAGFRAPR